jgi:hypothetical protein
MAVLPTELTTKGDGRPEPTPVRPRTRVPRRPTPFGRPDKTSDPRTIVPRKLSL